MPTSSPRPRGGLRALLALAVAAALALVPGPAGAADDPVDPAEVTGSVEDVLEDVGGAEGEGEAGGEEDLAPGGDEEEPPPNPLEELQALIDEIRGQLPENECVDGVAAALEDLLAVVVDPEALAEYQAAFEAYLLALEEYLGSLDPTDLEPPAPPTAPELPEPPDPAAFQAALEALAAALEECLTPPAEEPEEPEEPEQPAQPAGPSPGAQPVTYPGYAPTGAETAPDRADALVPLAAVGGALLLGGGVLAARSRRREG